MKLKIVILFNVISHIVYSQNDMRPFVNGAVNISHSTVIDSGNIRVLYALNAVNINDTETYDDLQVLEIGKNSSKYYSRFVFNSDSLQTDNEKNNKHTIAHGSVSRILEQRGKYGAYWFEYKWSEYFKNFSENMLTEYVRMPAYLGKYNSKSNEDIPVQKWELDNGAETLNISGCLCRKATCSFRGRSYTAWYAPEIPINNGPWKFGGLPGLILKVYDDDRHWDFECISVGKYQDAYPVVKYDMYERFADIDRVKLLELNKKIHDDYMGTAGLVSINPHADFKTEKIPFNPLETE